MLIPLSVAVALALGPANEPDRRDAVAAADTEEAKAQSGTHARETTKIAMRMPTLGGMQFWADVFFFADWRIQYNPILKHYRLLDGNNAWHAWGSFEKCEATFRRVREQRQLTPDTRKTVLLLHGIARSHHSMRPIAKHLESAGYRVHSVAYPSTRLRIADHAENLHQILSRLEGPSEISLVTHSMGGLIVRSYLSKYRDPRLKRLVMLGTPNQGAIKADQWKGSWAYRIVMGPAGKELCTDEDGIVCKLPSTLPIEFGIIAGGRGNVAGYSRSIPGDDDLTVSVESTRLAGARDFIVVPSLHTFLMNPPEVHRYIETFLAHGYFRTDEQRQEIPAEPRQEPAVSQPKE